VLLSSYGADPKDAPDELSKFHALGEGGQYKTLINVQEPNFEIFGLLEGRYSLTATLVDFDSTSRSCWNMFHVEFTVGRFDIANRSEALLMGMQRLKQNSGRLLENKSPWLVQPQTHRDFAYVTVLWSNDYVDAVLAWAAGLIRAGSTFPRICMVVQENMWQNYLDLLQRCCCDVLAVEPIASPQKVSAGADARYELALTKLRVLQLKKFGFKKIVLMDSDILVLQNIDELFWMPAPAATVSASTLLGHTTEPRLSTGVMVLEPSEEEFQSVMKRLHENVQNAESNIVLRFIEQDILDKHWFQEGKMRYHVLPLTYNLYPELLDTLPFLAPAVDPPEGEKNRARFPLDHGVKLVHLWHWYNPLHALLDMAKGHLQNHAKIKHPQMWHWYELWWELHQDGLKRAVPEKYEVWSSSCISKYAQRYGEEVAKKFVPTLLGLCNHIYGGMEW